MPMVSQEMKLLTLSLILRTMPREQQTLLMSHFSPEITRRLKEIEAESNVDVEKLDWTPIYQSWPELKKILSECKEQIRQQGLIKIAEEQRPIIKQYILMKLGMQKGAPVLLSDKVKKTIDKYLTSYRG
jgi:hypothetical protein